MTIIKFEKHLFLIFVFLLFGNTNVFAEAGSKPGIAVSPGLFTGTMSYSIPIEVPAGRKGMQPDLALTYASSNGNGWIGVGWELEIGAIERDASRGVNFNGDDFIIRMSGSAMNLVFDSVNNVYWAKIEDGNFFKITKKLASDGRISWEAKDKAGVTYIYGDTIKNGQAISRQDDTGDLNSANPNTIFKWCLEKVIDTNGNYMIYKYFKHDGQIYLDSIDYTGNGSLLPTNNVKFHIKLRPDAPDMYSTNFKVKTASRLKTIEIRANGELLRAYDLSYSSSSGSGSSLLVGIQQFGKDAYISYGSIISGSSLPAQTFSYSASDTEFSEGVYQDMNAGPTAIGFWPMDINGDAKTDLVQAWADNDSLKLITYLSNGSGFNPGTSQTMNAGQTAVGFWPMDVNGDGKMDLVQGWGNSGNLGLITYISNGSGFNAGTYQNMNAGPSAHGFWPMDVNGDGKTDLVQAWNGTLSLITYLSNGSGFNPGTYQTMNAGSTAVGFWPMDVNGDGKMDLVQGWGNSGTLGLITYTSNGSGFEPGIYKNMNAGPTGIGFWPMDIDGDGKTDLVQGWNNDTDPYVVTLTLITYLSKGPAIDLLSSISNGLGGAITVAYKPSTSYTNIVLPFPVETVSSITTCDNYNNSTLTCQGAVSTTNYSYLHGFYHIAERDFRGFNYVKETGPNGANGGSRITETWFHQGNEQDILLENIAGSELKTLAEVSVGYMKGKPYRTRVTNQWGSVYSETTTAYAVDSEAPYFNPPCEVNTSICDGDGVCGKQTKTVLTHDNSNGNLNRTDQHGDIDDPNDDFTVVKSYSPNTTGWIVGLPSAETIYKGIGTSTQVSETKFYYDGPSDCASDSTSQTPTKGNLTMIIRTLDPKLPGETDPVARMGYDPFGNMVCKSDAKGNISTITYESFSSTFPVQFTTPRIGTHPEGFKTITEYYGVYNDKNVLVSADNGLYGQVKRVKDANHTDASPVQTNTEYDQFGRKKKTTFPNGSWTAWDYNNFGTLNNTSDSQHILSSSSSGATSWIYFDGFSRTTRSKGQGSSTGRVIESITEYNNTGTVKRVRKPFFSGDTAEYWTSYSYDPLGRLLTTTFPDNSRSMNCYDDGVTVHIDANHHKKQITKDAFGRLIKVEEYLGTYNTCFVDSDSPYAVTTYDYDILGNLRFVKDAEGNQTEMRYDSLGRKTFMHEPDMGDWAYTYDANGNVKTQTDAKTNTIVFDYDELNRITKKDYPTGTDVNYRYDEPTSTYSVGRLSYMGDESGSTTYNYEVMGRLKSTIKTIADIDSTYTTTFNYEHISGRLSNIVYPDGETFNYTYDPDGTLWQIAGPGTNQTVINYATYGGYNAAAQPSTLTFGNTVTTLYEYNQESNRLTEITTAKTTNLLKLSYSYDLVGNVSGITDGIQAARSQSFAYDDLNRLQLVQTDNYGVESYAYSQIGNIVLKSLDNTTSSCPPGFILRNGQCVEETDSYGPWQTISCWPTQSCWSNAVDTCDGNPRNGYTCPEGIDKSCRDVSDYRSWEDGDAAWQYRTVTCLEIKNSALCPQSSVLNTGTNECEGSVVCSGGSYDKLSDSCYAVFPAGTPTCPSGTTLNKTTDRCESAFGCPVGYVQIGDECAAYGFWTYFQCYWDDEAAEWICDIGSDCNNDKLNAYSCPDGALKTCTDIKDSTATYWYQRQVSCQPIATDCPSGTTLDTSSNLCIAMPSCAKGIFDPSSDNCVEKYVKVTPVCPVGTAFNSTTDLCEASKGCPTGYILSGSECAYYGPINGMSCESQDECAGVTDSCDGSLAIYSCPAGVTKACTDIFNWENFGSDYAEYDYRSVFCTPQEADAQCPSGSTFNAASNQCEANPLCSVGTFDPVLNLCVTTGPVSPTCSSGLTFNPAEDTCEAPPSCATSRTYDPSKDLCILNQSEQYIYGSKPHQVISTPDGRSYIYDANGNMTTDSIRSMTYNYDNMPSTITQIATGATTTFIYDGNGNRVKKIAPSAFTTNTTIYIDKLYECRVGGSCVKYIYAGNNRIAQKTAGGEILYYHSDHLGSTRIVTSANGSEYEDIYYYPFGAAHSDAGDGSLTHKYTSQEFDAEIGLYNYNARFYNPSLGRFISADTLVPNYADPQQLNRYSYVTNNPLRYTDPTGHRRQNKHARLFNNPYTSAALHIAASKIGYYGIGSAVLGAYKGYAYGGHFDDILESAVITWGTSYASSYIMNWNTSSIAGYTGQVVASGIVGGASAHAQGGEFSKGFYMSAFSAGAELIYENSLTGVNGCENCNGQGPNPLPGLGRDDKIYYDTSLFGEKLATDWMSPVVRTTSENIGLANGGWFWGEGGLVSKTLNIVPGMNAVGVLHDIWNPLGATGPYLWRSIGTMVPAAVVTYSALLSGNASVSLAVSRSTP